MFGSYEPIGSNTAAPEWIRKLVAEIESSYSFDLNQIYFKDATKEDTYAACYWLAIIQ